MATHEHSQKTDSSEDPGTVIFGPHVVAIIDFLGQSIELAKWEAVPKSPHDQEQFEEAIRNSFGRIHAWRMEFEKIFTLWLRNQHPPKEVVAELPNRGETLLKFQDSSLGFMRFSDTIVVYTPLENQHGYFNAGGICGFFLVCGTLMLSALCQKTVFRGAIEIGMAGRFPDADLYGPVLAHAHHLESKVAQYPRIVVGQGVLKYLQFHVDNAENDGPARANHVTAARCLRMLSQDSDGSWIIDYLNDDAFTSPRSDQSGRRGLKSGAAKFVRDELDRFKSEGNDTLVERYKRLAAYFRRHGLGA